MIIVFSFEKILESLLSLLFRKFCSCNVLLFVCCCLQPWWSNKSNFVLGLVALCSLSTRWLRGSKIHHQQDSMQDSKVYTTIVRIFFNIFSICVLVYCLGFNQNMLQNWFMWTCCTWFNFSYQKEAMCWYCMSHQLVSTWCEFNDLLRFLKNVLQGSLGLVNKMEKANFNKRKETIWI